MRSSEVLTASSVRSSAGRDRCLVTTTMTTLATAPDLPSSDEVMLRFLFASIC